MGSEIFLISWHLLGSSYINAILLILNTPSETTVDARGLVISKSNATIPLIEDGGLLRLVYDCWVHQHFEATFQILETGLETGHTCRSEAAKAAKVKLSSPGRSRSFSLYLIFVMVAILMTLVRDAQIASVWMAKSCWFMLYPHVLLIPFPLGKYHRIVFYISIKSWPLVSGFLLV